MYSLYNSLIEMINIIIQYRSLVMTPIVIKYTGFYDLKLKVLAKLL